MKGRSSAQRAQGLNIECRCRQAIDVEIAPHGDLLLLHHRACQALDGHVQVGQRLRWRGRVRIGVEEPARLGRIVDPAPHQELGDQRDVCWQADSFYHTAQGRRDVDRLGLKPLYHSSSSASSPDYSPTMPFSQVDMHDALPYTYDPAQQSGGYHVCAATVEKP